MCGITGFADFNADFLKKRDEYTALLAAMHQTIAHRGGDASGEYLAKNVGLGHARLTIRGLDAASDQPMVRRRGADEFAIVYNGEIYNTDEINSELTKKGYKFKTESDTETVLYAYMEYGTDCVKLLNGIFAFAVWDGAAESLFLFRDRSGIKPLFYTIQNGLLVFGSELKAIFAHPDITPVIDADSLRKVFSVLPARTEGDGVFKNMYEIKYGCYGVFNKNGFSRHRYWQLESAPHTEDYDTTADHLKSLIVDSVRRQMVSDVPVCSFLSGGLDSCIVTAIASDYLAERKKILNTFSFDFTENDRYFKSNSFQPEQDKPFVRKMLASFNLNHTFLECGQTELADYLYKAVDAKDMPGMADVDASLFYFCELVKKHNKVTLTGECADEIFGGYPWFHKAEFINADTFPWSVNLDVRESLLKSDIAEKLKIKDYVHDIYNQTLAEVPRLDGETGIKRRQREISYLNLKQFMTTLLWRMDTASMYSGLEARVPFADHRIIEYMWNVPFDM
ncbi:MAG: asparagine synthase (glutamine-hydrolyzing), partial [Firmicutes bacterium]|nr:asparagine synthase (glutamine-hydrolyzing) [Bacillota bacterium]